jgi:hypothetical protein
VLVITCVRQVASRRQLSVRMCYSGGSGIVQRRERESEDRGLIAETKVDAGPPARPGAALPLAVWKNSPFLACLAKVDSTRWLATVF